MSDLRHKAEGRARAGGRLSQLTGWRWLPECGGVSVANDSAIAPSGGRSGAARCATGREG